MPITLLPLLHLLFARFGVRLGLLCRRLFHLQGLADAHLRRAAAEAAGREGHKGERECHHEQHSTASLRAQLMVIRQRGRNDELVALRVARQAGDEATVLARARGRAHHQTARAEHIREVERLAHAAAVGDHIGHDIDFRWREASAFVDVAHVECAVYTPPELCEAVLQLVTRDVAALHPDSAVAQCAVGLHVRACDGTGADTSLHHALLVGRYRVVGQHTVHISNRRHVHRTGRDRWRRVKNEALLLCNGAVRACQPHTRGERKETIVARKA
ncbi:hypothetical protein, unknown function [Leishmania tarentolae]|uniref:Secreted protein n=1 Tax=Leishmania tarentolae TaxID=5689 RepID=A0A640KAP7_LEITA|nr:hypothetical protein, unknown function [Leishmania tarentolae]